MCGICKWTIKLCAVVLVALGLGQYLLVNSLLDQKFERIIKHTREMKNDFCECKSRFCFLIIERCFRSKTMR